MQIEQPKVLDCERALLGSFFLNNDFIEEAIIAGLKPNDFYLNAHQDIFKIMLKCKPVELVTVVESARSLNLLNVIGGASYVVSLSDNATKSPKVMESHLATILQKSCLRKQQTELYTLCESIEQDSDPNEIATKAAQISTLDAQQEQDDDNLGPALLHTLDKLEKAYKGEVRPCTPTSILKLDEHAPMFPGDLCVIAGRPGSGKTSFLLKIAYGAAVEGKRILFYSLEMPRDQIVNRLISMVCGVNLQKFRAAQTLDDKEYAKISNAIGRLCKLQIIIKDRHSQTIDQITRDATRAKRKQGVDLVIIDHLGKIAPRDQRLTDYQRATESANYAKNLAKALDIPVILAAQLNRCVEARKPPIPVTSDLRDSGRVEEEADSVILLYRQDHAVESGLMSAGDKDLRTDLVGNALIRVTKNRHGEAFQFKLPWIGKNATFGD